MPLATRDIDYFLEIARTGQLSLAATQLQVSAAALSKAIRRLEGELGVHLFERSGQGMALTPFGTSFQERARLVKAAHDDALRHAGDVRAGRAGLLRIGATVAVLDGVVSQALARLQPHRPGLHAQLTVASSDQVLDRARQGSLDVSVVPVYTAMPQGLDHQVIGQDGLVPVLRSGHPLLRARRLDLQRLAGCLWVLPRSPSAARMQFDGVFQAAGLPTPQAAVEVDATSAWSLPLVASTDLLAMVPRSALHRLGGRSLRELEFQALHLPRNLAAFWRPQAYRSPLAQEFVAALGAG